MQFLPQTNARRSFGRYAIPKDHTFLLGDNRDASNDSRTIGPGPRRLLIGHVNHIVVSADILGIWMPRRTGKKGLRMKDRPHDESMAELFRDDPVFATKYLNDVLNDARQARSGVRRASLALQRDQLGCSFWIK